MHLTWFVSQLQRTCTACVEKTLSRCCKRPMQLGFACETNSSAGDWISEQKSVRLEHCQALIYTNNNWSTCSPFFFVPWCCAPTVISIFAMWNLGTWTWWSHISWGLSTVSIIHFLVSSEGKQICDVSVTRIICVYNKRWQGQQMARTMLKYLVRCLQAWLKSFWYDVGIGLLVKISHRSENRFWNKQIAA